METFDYLSALRRRWAVIAITVVIALAGALFISWLQPPRRQAPTYEASSLLLGPADDTLDTMAILATVADVRERVANRLGFSGDVREFTPDVQALADEDAGALWITARASDPDQAKLLSDAFAEEFVAYQTDARASAIAGEAKHVTRRMAQLENELASVSPTEIGISSARHEALLRVYGFLEERYQQLVSEVPAASVYIVQEGIPSRLPDSGLTVLRTLPGRLALATLIALIAGLGLALLFERSDSRIRTRASAERHFGLPVIAEIPFVRQRKGPDIVAASKPKSLAADEFRFLAAALVQGVVEDHGSESTGNGEGSPPHPKRILVCSPGSSEGSTTVAANLATVFGEAGKNVLALSCDLRRPGLHRWFGVSGGEGLAEALQSANGRPMILNGYVRMTPFKNVRIVPGGSPPEKPAELLSSEEMRRALAEARQRAEVVVMDSAPVLTASDASHLVPEVDAVVVVARAGKTTAEQAELTAERLRRLGAPVLGVVLNAATETVVGGGRNREGAAETRRRGFPGLVRHGTGD